MWHSLSMMPQKSKILNPISIGHWTSEPSSSGKKQLDNVRILAALLGRWLPFHDTSWLWPTQACCDRWQPGCFYQLTLLLMFYTFSDNRHACLHLILLLIGKLGLTSDTFVDIEKYVDNWHSCWQITLFLTNEIMLLTNDTPSDKWHPPGGWEVRSIILIEASESDTCGQYRTPHCSPIKWTTEKKECPYIFTGGHMWICGGTLLTGG